MVDTFIILYFCPKKSPRRAYCTATPSPSLSWYRHECGGSADPQRPHKELWTIKKVDSFYADLPLCSVWGLILTARELSGCQGDRCDVLASSRAAAEPLSHRQAGTAEPGNRWEPLGSPRLWRMKNQKKPYWTQIQRESPAPFLSSLVLFLPFLRKHQWMWKAVFPLEAFECSGTPDAILCKWFHPFLPGEMFLNPSAYPFLSLLGRKGKMRDENTFQTTISSASLWLSGNVVQSGGCGCSVPGIDITILFRGRVEKKLGSKAQKEVKEVPMKSFENTRCFPQIWK